MYYTLMISRLNVSDPIQHGRVSKPRQRHRRFGETLEEVRGERMSREGEIPPGVEEQEFPAETLHDESIETRSYVECYQVSDIN